MENLKIALVQTDLYWQDRGANLAMLEEKIWSLQGKVDLIVLPEMFPTGFSMEVEKLGEPMNFTTTKWLQQMASQTKAVVTGSVIIKDGKDFYNRLLWVRPDGEVSYYDKRHLFRMADEEHHFSMGTKRELFSLKGWRILPQVCYDLRFPVWSRNISNSNGQMEYDLAFYIASWPAARDSAWDVLLKARAVENLCYTLGVNRVGEDGNGIAYSGHSGAYDFKGGTMAFSSEKEEVLLVTLDAEALVRYREKFPAWMDADRFEIK
ncbi:amidohydrolase [Echinicola strongylocentroti]|uniref:Omega-amidase YafV n=1 Tax=Echinicola strongylocentroti TaxID=1795355 RepID=A0A2Z4IKX8_9BACT|nr:amidohydrolase [Echinicola strongylocentroti]AWW31397.1 amidohydrolase [Echinicola strongylocentroti]